MSMTATLRDALKSAAAIQALVEDRVYRDERPQNDPLPAIVMLLVSDPRPWTFTGPQSLRQSRVQIDCLAESRGLSDEIAEAVISSVDGRSLTAVPPFESVRVNNVRNDSSRDSPATTFRTMIDALVWHYST